MLHGRVPMRTAAASHTYGHALADAGGRVGEAPHPVAVTRTPDVVVAVPGLLAHSSQEAS